MNKPPPPDAPRAEEEAGAEQPLRADGTVSVARGHRTIPGEVPVESTGRPETLIARVRRAVGVRERVYPGWIERGRIKPETAERELAHMRAALRTLERFRLLQEGGAP